MRDISHGLFDIHVMMSIINICITIVARRIYIYILFILYYICIYNIHIHILIFHIESDIHIDIIVRHNKSKSSLRAIIMMHYRGG